MWTWTVLPMNAHWNWFLRSTKLDKLKISANLFLKIDFPAEELSIWYSSYRELLCDIHLACNQHWIARRATATKGRARLQRSVPPHFHMCKRNNRCGSPRCTCGYDDMPVFLSSCLPGDFTNPGNVGIWTRHCRLPPQLDCHLGPAT